MLDKGEVETLALVLQEGEKELLMDEGIGRKIARLYGLTPRGSLRTLVLGYSNGVLEKEQVNECLRAMLQANFRVSAEVLARFWELLERIN